MKIIVGLGNIGTKYEATRHNIGFDVVERFAYENNIELKKKKHKAILGEGFIGGEKIVLALPQTYMNLSGLAVRELVRFYPVELEDLLVVYDDSYLDLGKLRIRKKGGHGGHNGMKNIISHLGSKDFPRLRVGVGPQTPGMDLANFVLKTYTKDELRQVVEVVKKGTTCLETIIKKGIDHAMNTFNGC